MSGQITDLAVTLLPLSPGDKYIRFGKIATPAFLWLLRGEGDPITDFKILHDDSDPGDDFTKIKQNLSSVEGEHVYICYGKDSTKSPIIDVKIVTSENPSAGPGFTRVPERLNPNASSNSPVEWLCWKTRESEAKVSEAQFAVGAKLDVLDTANTWLPAEVMEVKKETNEIFIHYINYSERWDEWLPMRSPRVAPYKTYTGGRGANDRPPFKLHMKLEEFRANLEELKTLAEQGDDNTSVDEQFLTSNHKYIKDCLNASIDDPSLIVEVQSFFQTCIKLFTSRLKEQPLHHLFCDGLASIFGQPTSTAAGVGRFYTSYGIGAQNSEDGKYASRGSHTQSVHLFENINYFGSLNGFDIILKRLVDSDGEFKNDKLTTVAGLVKVVSCAALWVNEEWSVEYVKNMDLPSIISSRLAAITDAELKTLDKTQFSTLLQDVRSVQLNAGKCERKDTMIFTEQSHLDISLRMLKSAVFEKRLHGLDGLAECLNKTKPTSDRGQVVRPNCILEPEYLVKWIEEKNLLSIAMGGNAHSEMMRRSVPILAFLARERALSVDHINMIWDAGFGKHEDAVRVVYDILGNLSSDLSEEHLDELYGRIEKVPLDQFADYDLDYVKTFTVNAVRRNTNKSKWYGLNLFWLIIQDGVSCGDEVAKYSSQCLVDLLKMPEFRVKRNDYLMECLHCLEQGVSVVQALQLSKDIIHMYSPIADKRGQYIHELDQTQLVINKVVDNLTTYTQNKALQSDDSKESKSTSRYDHKKQLQTRLEFLEYLLVSSVVTLTNIGIDRLWSAFVTKSVEPADKAMFLTWLGKAVQFGNSNRRYERSAFKDETITHTFTQCLCDETLMDYTTLSSEEYNCFELYFLKVNANNNSLINHGAEDVSVVAYEKLEGLSPLWKIAVYNENLEVAAPARQFLTTLFLRLGFSIKDDQKNEIRQSFIQRCNKLCQEAYQSTPPNFSIAGVLVDLQTRFLTRIENGDMIGQPAFHKGQDVRARWRGGGFYNAKIQKIQPDGTYHVLYCDGDVDTHCLERHIVAIDAESKQQQQLNLESDPQARFPKMFMSNDDECFQLFFDLLGEGGEVAIKVWQLLDKLPPNQSLKSKIESLVSSNESDFDSKVWQELLPKEQPIKLLYALQIVAFSMCPKRDNEGAKKDASPEVTAEEKKEEANRAVFTENFYRRGGFLHVYDILVNYDLGEISNLVTQRCLSSVYQIVVHFLSNDSVSMVNEIMTKIDAEELIQYSLRALKSVVDCDSSLMSAAATEAEAREANSVQGALVAFIFSSINSVLHIKSNTSSLVDMMYKWEHLENLITGGLVKHPNQELRKAVVEGIQELARVLDNPPDGMDHPRLVLLPILLTCLENMDTNKGSSAGLSSYFELIQQLLKGVRADQLGAIDPATLAMQLADKIKNHPVVEESPEQPDELLCGLISLVLEVVRQVPSLKEAVGGKCGLLEDLFECLFAVPEPSDKYSGLTPPPKCCNANASQAVAVLTPRHLKSHSNGKQPHKFDFKVENEEKAKSGYVGIKNLGCVCYMISIIQQMYNISSLRHNILGVDIYKDEDMSESALYQLQTVMAFLQESEKQFCNPKSFCHAFKTWDGKPTPVNVQEDAGQFLTRLIDKITTDCKGTRHEKVFSQTLGGIFSHELIGRSGCTHYREREEEYFAVSVPVKNKSNLQEALEAFIEGELLEGGNAFRCERCQKKVDTLKRVCFKTLPPTIAFVLRRFELDYMTMQTTKINDKLVFPEFLNLKPYTKEFLGHPDHQRAKDSKSKDDDADADGATSQADTQADAKAAAAALADSGYVPAEFKDEGYYNYKLKGVVVHRGTATTGHYYSLIEERGAVEDGQEAHWFEFNDNIVRPFKKENLAEEAYGITEKPSAQNRGNHAMMGDYGGYGSADFQIPDESENRKKSAYILFYDRVRQAEAVVENAEPEPLSFEGAAAAVVFRGKLVNQQKKRQRALIPPQIFDHVWSENLTYWHDKAVFDRRYFDFVWSVVNSVEVTDRKDNFELLTNATELAVRFVMMALCRSHNKESINQWCGKLKELLAINPKACQWFLETMSSQETGWNHDYLLICTDVETRKKVGEVVCAALGVVIPLETEKFAAALESPDLKCEDSVAIKYVDNVLAQLSNVSNYWKHFNEYFRVLEHFASSGEIQAQYLIKKGVLGKLVDLYLGDESPHPVANIPVNARGKRPEIGTKWKRPDFSSFLQLIKDLVDVSTLGASPDHSTDEKESDEKTTSLPPMPLPAVDEELVLSKLFLQRVITEAISRRRGRSVVSIIKSLVTENEKLSQTMVSYVIMGIDDLPYDRLRPYFRVLTGLIMVKDSLHPKRVDWIMTSLLATMKNNQRYWKVTDFCIEHMIRLCKKSPLAYAWLQERKNEFEWILNWLFMNPRPPFSSRNNNDENALQVHKPNREVNQWQQTTSYPSHVGLNPAEKKAYLDKIHEGKEKEPYEHDASDSDLDLQDRVLIRGDKVDCLDGRVWRSSTIVKVNGSRVEVSFDGWDSGWNEWMDMSSARIMPHGTKAKASGNSSSGNGARGNGENNGGQRRSGFVGPLPPTHARSNSDETNDRPNGLSDDHLNSLM